MESATRDHNRTPMTCPVCFRTDRKLSTHLKRNCMKNNTEEERKVSLEQAKKTLLNIASKGTAIRYQEIMSLGSLENVVPFLEDRGFIITNKPTIARNDQQKRTSTSLSAAILTLPHSMAAIQEEPIEEKDVKDTVQTLKPKRELKVRQVHVTLERNLEDIPTSVEPEDPKNVPEEPREDDHGEEDSEENEGNLDKQTQRILQTKWTSDKRKKMLAAGLYQRHSLDDPLLKGFASYLRDTLWVTNYKQEVEDVARFLFYMNPRKVSLQFVRDVEKTNSFFTKLRELNLANQTIFNYLKHVRRFITFQLRSTNLFDSDPKLHKSLEFFQGITEDIRKRLAKGISRDVVSKRYQALTSSLKTPQECRQLLVVAKPSFLRCIKAVRCGHSDQNSHLEILYYLEALIVLKHLQRPGVVQNMTVSEWKERISHRYNGEDLVVIGVKSHKTASQQVATFVLNKEEEMWFKVYFEKVRPKLVQKETLKDIFFISTTGKEIYNVSNDIMRYHKKFKLPNISSQLVRRVCETWTMPRYSDSEKCLFAKYLAHTNLTAERNYREKTLTDICHGHQLVMQSWQGMSDEPKASTSRNLDPGEEDHGLENDDFSDAGSHRAEDENSSMEEDYTSQDEDSCVEENRTEEDCSSQEETTSDQDDYSWSTRAKPPSSTAIRTRAQRQKEAESSRTRSPRQIAGGHSGRWLQRQMRRGSPRRRLQMAGASSKTRSQRQKEEGSSRTQSHRQKEGGSSRTRSHRQKEDGSSRTQSHRQKEEGSSRTRSHRQKEGESSRTQSHRQKEGESSRTQSHRQKEGESSRTQSHRQKEGESSRTQSHRQIAEVSSRRRFQRQMTIESPRRRSQRQIEERNSSRAEDTGRCTLPLRRK